MSEYRSLVKKGREQFRKEVESLTPEVFLGKKGTDTFFYIVKTIFQITKYFLSHSKIMIQVVSIRTKRQDISRSYVVLYHRIRSVLFLIFMFVNFKSNTTYYHSIGLLFTKHAKYLVYKLKRMDKIFIIKFSNFLLAT